jgi:hypothetical protein
MIPGMIRPPALAVLAASLFLGCVDLEKPATELQDASSSVDARQPDSATERPHAPGASNDATASLDGESREEPPWDAMASQDAPGTAEPPLDAGPLPCSKIEGCPAGFACVMRSCSALAAGLVAHWKFDGTYADSSPSALPAGTMVGTVAWAGVGQGAPGSRDNALTFVGSAGSYIDMGSPAAVNFGTGSFSYGLWVKVDHTLAPTAGNAYHGPADIPLSKGGGHATSPGYDVECGTANWNAYIADDMSNVQGGPQFLFTANNFPPVGWQHLLAVRDTAAQQVRTYRNGVLVVQQILTVTGSVSSATPLRIGGGTSSFPFKGQVDDVRLYNRALSAEEILALSLGY